MRPVGFTAAVLWARNGFRFQGSGMRFCRLHTHGFRVQAQVPDTRDTHALNQQR